MVLLLNQTLILTTADTSIFEKKNQKYENKDIFILKQPVETLDGCFKSVWSQRTNTKPVSYKESQFGQVLVMFGDIWCSWNWVYPK